MKISAAQLSVSDSDIQQNISKHVNFTKKAIAEGCRLIVFPEMSLTGYMRERANEFCFEIDDYRLDILKHLSSHHNITIVVGAPVKVNSKLCIGSFIIQPVNSTLLYTKQYLHEGEELFFEHNFNYNPQISIGNETVSFAICSDISNAKHAENAAKSNTSLYIASIYFTPNGINEAFNNLSAYSKKHSMNILMSNFVGKSYHYTGAGNSSFWNKEGTLIGNCNSSSECLLIIDINNNHSFINLI